MSSVYILYSLKLNKYYTGFTDLNVSERLSRHLEEYYQNKFTAAAKDWKLFLRIECQNQQQAMKIEKHIKKMKSKIYIENLKKYPEMIANLKEKMLK